MRKTILISLLLVISFPLISSTHPYTQSASTNPINTENFSVLKRVENSGFSNFEEEIGGKADFTAWTENHGSTHKLGVKKGEWAINGSTLHTKWKDNGYNAEASVSQKINLTGVDAFKIDVIGTDGNSERSKIILEIDGEQEGIFIKAPQPTKLYTDLGVDLTKEYRGEHRITIKWVQISGDNIGTSGIDNVKALSSDKEDYQPNNTMTNQESFNHEMEDSKHPIDQPTPVEPIDSVEQPTVGKSVEDMSRQELVTALKVILSLLK